MKKILFGAAALFLMASCGGKGEDKTSSDSSAVIDTAVQANSDTQNGKGAVQNSEDNLSTTNDENESKAILAALPDPKKLIKAGDPTKYLKSLGFKGSKKEKTNEFGEITLVGTYSFNAGKKSISVRWENLMGSNEWDVTIKNDDKALEEFYSNAKKQQGKGEYWEKKVKKSGNTVKITYNSD